MASVWAIATSCLRWYATGHSLHGALWHRAGEPRASRERQLQVRPARLSLRDAQLRHEGILVSLGVELAGVVDCVQVTAGEPDGVSRSQ